MLQHNHSSALYRSFRRNMAEHGLPRADSHILIAFSGGADSTALLHLTHALVMAQKQKPRLTALHVNHGIRGEEAARDADFCRQCCDQLGIPFVLFEANAPAEATQRHVTLEEAARDIRYRLITQYLTAHVDITCVLTAHHADDQAETVLFRLLRGTSAHGLIGIPAVRMLSVDNGTREVPLIRPLLSFSKEALYAYLQELGADCVTDSTNAENDASRNLLRNVLIPTAKQINPSFPDAIRRLGGQAEEDEDFFAEHIRAFYEQNTITPTDPIPTDALLACHTALIRRILARVYETNRMRFPALKPLSSITLDAMLHALHSQNTAQLSQGYIFSAENGFCRITQKQNPAVMPDYRIPLPPGESVVLPCGAVCLFCDGSVKSSENLLRLKNIYKFVISTHINSDKLIGSIYLRPRRDNQTDRYLCGGSVKTAKDALSAHRVPAHLRKIVPLFCDEDGIVWIPHCGIRDSVNPRLMNGGTQIDLYYFYNGEV